MNDSQTLKENQKRAVAICSGGLDSSVLAYQLASDGYALHLLGFDYGQRHIKELDFAARLATGLGARFTRLDLTSLRPLLRGSALTQDDIEVPHGHYAAPNMAITVVPNRNAIMLAMAYAAAVSDEADVVACGVHAGDHCLPASTPVLARAGLKPIAELQANEDEVLSFNVQTREVEWRTVSHVWRKGVPERIWEFKARSGARWRCTGEHKIYTVQRSNWTRKRGWQKELVQCRAADLRVGDYVLLPAGAPVEASRRTLSKPVDLLPFVDAPCSYDETHLWFKRDKMVNRFVDTSAFLELTAWYVTEGYAAPGNLRKPNGYGVYIAQSEAKNPERLNAILRACQAWGLRSRTHGYGSKSAVYFSGPSTRALLRCGNNSRSKKLPDEMLALPNEQIALLLNTLMEGDGWRRSETCLEYITTSNALVQQVSYLGARLGFRASVVLQSGKSDCRSVFLSRSKAKPNLNRYGQSALTPITSIEEISNNEAVYDITVEGNHNFFAGDVGFVLVSNSVYPDCRPEFIASFERMQRVATEGFSRPNLRLFAPFLNVSKTDIVRQGAALGVAWEETWSCYEGGKVHCGRCGTCVERREAFADAGVRDPTIYAAGTPALNAATPSA